MDSYIEKRLLGYGGFGRADLVKRKSDKKFFVIKTMTIDQNLRKKFAENEVKILQQARHHNVVRTFEHWYTDTSIRIVLAYCDGGDVGQAIRRQKPIPFDDLKVMNWMSQLLNGLKYLHDMKILHRDLKPSNLLLTNYQRHLLIADFGLSRIVDSQASASTVGIGTLHYMAPELFEEGKYGKEVDIWSTGCILYKLVNLKEAFDGDKRGQIMKKILTSSYDEPTRGFCSDLIAQCLIEDGSKRPTVDDLIDNIMILKLRLEELSSRNMVALNARISLCQSENNDDSQSETSSCHSTVADIESVFLSQSQPTLTSQNFNSSYQVFANEGLCSSCLWDTEISLITLKGNYSSRLTLSEEGHVVTKIGDIYSATIRGDSKCCLGHRDGSVSILTDGKAEIKKLIHNEPIKLICALPNNCLFTASNDGLVKVIDENLETLKKWKSQNDVNCIATNGENVALSFYRTKRTSIRVYKTMTSSVVEFLIGHTDRINSLDWSTDLLASGSHDSTVRLWQPELKRSALRILRHEQPVCCVRFGSGSKAHWLYSCSMDKTTLAWNSLTGEQLFQVNHQNIPWCLDVNQTGSILVIGHRRGTTVCDSSSGRKVKSYKSSYDISDVKFNKDGHQLVIIEHNGQIYVIDAC